MTGSQWYFASRGYSISTGVLAFSTSVVSIVFIFLGLFGLSGNALQAWCHRIYDLQALNPLLRELISRIDVAAIFLALGCFSGIVFSYGMLLEFWRRARPLAINERGVKTFIFGAQLRFLPWSAVVIIIKSRHLHPLGYIVEYVRIQGGKVRGQGMNMDQLAFPSQVIVEQSNKGWFAIFPEPEIWVTIYMGLAKFRVACDIISHYANLHRIPMVFWDATPAAVRARSGTSAVIHIDKL